MYPSDAKEIGLLQSSAIITVFIGMATWTTVSNKIILNDVLLNSNFLFLMQCAGAIIMLNIARLFGLVGASVLQVSFDRKEQFAIALSYTANVAFGLCSLNYVSIPMFGALKRITLLLCWAGEYYLEGRGNYAVLPSLALILLGTLAAGWYDLEFSFFGYLFGMLSCAGQAIAFVLSKKLTKSDAKKQCDGEITKSQGPESALDTVLSVVYLNSVVSAVFMSVVVFLQSGGDGEKLWRSDSGSTGHSDWSAMSQVILNVVSVLALNVVIFLDCTLNSPLTHAVAGNFKAGVTTIAGFIIFRTPCTPLGGMGLLLCFAGGLHYSWVKVQGKPASDDSASERMGSPVSVSEPCPDGTPISDSEGTLEVVVGQSGCLSPREEWVEQRAQLLRSATPGEAAAGVCVSPPPGSPMHEAQGRPGSDASFSDTPRSS